jgi:transposase
VKAARGLWKQNQSQPPAERLIFLDESGAMTNMARRFGRAPIGQRVVSAVPGGHWKTVSMIGAIAVDGVVASMAVQGSVDGEVFKVYVRQILAPQLRAGDVVVMDNLSSHKVAGVREMIEQTGAKLMYLPPYSPDLNPIENIWSKIKQKLRSIGARTLEALLDAISEAFASVTPEDCQRSIRHCGYTLHNSG